MFDYYLFSDLKNNKTYNFKELDFFKNKTVVLQGSLRPKISILIPVFNQILYTLNCLHSLTQECEKHELEIIIINDNSNDETDLFLNVIKGITIINNEKNLGFLKNINKGIIKAQGEFVLLLNNDVIVLPNLISELLHVFETKANVGAVGAMAIHPSGIVLEAGSTLFSSGEATNIGRAKSPLNPHYNYVKSVDYCSGYCLLLKRNLPNGELVQLDELFLPAYYEETDLCMQLKHTYGLSIYYQPFARLIHFESISYSDKKKDIKDTLIETNRKKFKNKWSKALVEKKEGKTKSPPDYIDASTHKGIIYLDDSINDESIRILEQQNNAGRKVTVILKTEIKIGKKKIEALQRNGIEVLYPFISSREKKRTYFNIVKKTLPYFGEVKTRNLFYLLYFRIFRKT